MKISTCIVNFSTILTLLACGTNSNQKSDELKPPVVEEAKAQIPSPQVGQGLPQISFLIDDVSKLPTCDANRQGALAYVRANVKFMTCQSENWITIEIKGGQGAKGEKGEPGAIAVATPTPTPEIETYFTLRLSYFVGYLRDAATNPPLVRQTKSIALPKSNGKLAMAKLSCTLRQIDESLYECEYKDSPFNSKECYGAANPNIKENRDILGFYYDATNKQISAKLYNGRIYSDRTDLLSDSDRYRDFCFKPQSGFTENVVDP